MKPSGLLSIFFIGLFIMMTAALITAIVSARQACKVRQLRFIPFYCMASFLQSMVFIIDEFVIKIGKVAHLSVGIFTLLEFVFFSNYLQNQLISNKKKSLLAMINSIFLIFLICTWFHPYHLFYYPSSDVIFVIESFLLVIPCLFYYFELFKAPLLIDLKNSPSFWIITGIFFLSSTSIPLFLLISALDKMQSYYEMFYSLNYVLYIILFLLFIRASTCKAQTEAS